MSDAPAVSESTHVQENTAMASELKSILMSQPDKDVAKARISISNPQKIGVWRDASDEPFRPEVPGDQTYASVDFGQKFGPEMSFEKIVKLARSLQLLVSENAELRAPDGIMRATDLIVERRGSTNNLEGYEFELKVATRSGEDKKTSENRLQRLINGIYFNGQNGDFVPFYDKFAVPAEN